MRQGFPDAPIAGKNGNYPLYAKLGAVALVQATPTATGLHVAVHDVAQQKVARVKDFGIGGTPNSREWRMSVHNVSDELEAWVTGVRGIAATRVAYVQGLAERPIVRDRQRRSVSDARRRRLGRDVAKLARQGNACRLLGGRCTRLLPDLRGRSRRGVLRDGSRRSAVG